MWAPSDVTNVVVGSVGVANSSFNVAGDVSADVSVGHVAGLVSIWTVDAVAVDVDDSGRDFIMFSGLVKIDTYTCKLLN